MTSAADQAGREQTIRVDVEASFAVTRGHHAKRSKSHSKGTGQS